VSDLPENHYNGLVFSVIRPHFSEHHYNADGMRTTKLQRKQLEAGESTDMANDSGSAESEDNNSFPATKIAEVREDVQLTGVPTSPEASTSRQRLTLRLNTVADLTHSAAASNPASTIHLKQTSALSSASSANVPLPLTLSDTVTQGRLQRRQQQASDFQASSKTERSSAGKDAWDMYF
jgi:hypothetical protein